MEIGVTFKIESAETNVKKLCYELFSLHGRKCVKSDGFDKHGHDLLSSLARLLSRKKREGILLLSYARKIIAGIFYLCLNTETLTAFKPHSVNPIACQCIHLFVHLLIHFIFTLANVSLR